MALATNTPLVAPGGWVLAGDVQKGDWLYNPLTGLPTQVTLVHKYKPSVMYEVMTSDYARINVDGNQKFAIKTIKCRKVDLLYRTRKRDPKRKVRPQFREQRYATVDQMLEKGIFDYRKEANFAFKTTKPIQWAAEDHPVPPFIVGMWMTRTNKNSRFVPQKSVLEYVTKKIREVGWGFVAVKSNIYQVRPSITTSFLTKYAKIPLKMPIEYAFGSVEQRIELLRGLVALKPKCYDVFRDEFRIRSRDIRFLIPIQGILESLGIRTTIFEYENRILKELVFNTDIELVPNQQTKGSTQRRIMRNINKITEIQPVECIHIETTEPFAAGAEFFPLWH